MAFTNLLFSMVVLFGIYKVVDLAMKRYERLKAMQKLEGEELIAYLGKAAPEEKSHSLERSKWWLMRIASTVIGAGVSFGLSPIIVSWAVGFEERHNINDIAVTAFIGIATFISAMFLLIELIIEHKVRKGNEE